MKIFNLRTSTLLLISLCSIVNTFAYKSPVSDSRVFIASERIIVLMKTSPNRYTQERVITALEFMQEQTSGNKKLLLQQIQEIVLIFDLCRNAWWEWRSSHHECEYIKKDVCEDVLWGIYNNCASACRHMWDTICTLECIPLCSLR